MNFQKSFTMIKIKCDLNKFIYFIQHRLLVLFLVLFFNQSMVFSQASTNEFNVYADRINLMISKALLAEKGFDDSKLVNGMNYDQFIQLINPRENKQVAIDINDIKIQIVQKYDRSNLIEKLKEFFNSSVRKIPNQNAENRKKTITALHSEFSKILVELESKLETEIKSDIKTDNKSGVKKIEVEAGNNMFEYIIWITVFILLIFCVVIFLYLINLKKDYQHIKHRFNEFEKDQKATNQKYSEKQSNVFNQRRTDSVLISDSEIERVKSIVFEDVSRRINEAEYFKLHLPQNQSSDSSIDSSQEIETAKFIVKFIETPEKDGYFDKNFLKNSDDVKSLYKIIFYPGSNKIEYDILTDKVIIHRNAMDHSQIMLKPACEFIEEPSPNDTKIYRADSKPGTIEAENDKLIIIDKIRIKFG